MVAPEKTLFLSQESEKPTINHWCLSQEITRGVTQGRIQDFKIDGGTSRAQSIYFFCIRTPFNSGGVHNRARLKSTGSSMDLGALSFYLRIMLKAFLYKNKNIKIVDQNLKGGGGGGLLRPLRTRLCNRPSLACIFIMDIFKDYNFYLFFFFNFLFTLSTLGLDPRHLRCVNRTDRLVMICISEVGRNEISILIRAHFRNPFWHLHARFLIPLSRTLLHWSVYTWSFAWITCNVLIRYLWHIIRADPGFPMGGGGVPKITCAYHKLEIPYGRGSGSAF